MLISCTEHGDGYFLRYLTGCGCRKVRSPDLKDRKALIWYRRLVSSTGDSCWKSKYWKYCLMDSSKKPLKGLLLSDEGLKREPLMPFLSACWSHDLWTLALFMVTITNKSLYFFYKSFSVTWLPTGKVVTRFIYFNIGTTIVKSTWILLNNFNNYVLVFPRFSGHTEAFIL